MSKTDEDIKILETSIFETAGGKFNLASQNSWVFLFDKLKLVV
jgi:hypothetical protein